MKKLRTMVGLLTLVVGMALAVQAGDKAAKQEPVDPDTVRVLWATADHQEPSFLPQALIGDLDLTSPETVDFSHLPLTDTQKYNFKFFLFLERQAMDSDGCFVPPIAARGRPRNFEPLSLVELMARQQVVTTGVVQKIVPGWSFGSPHPANMIFVEVEEVLRDANEIAIPGQPLVFLRHSGAEVTVSGQHFCSPVTDTIEVRVGSRILLYGSDHGSDIDRISGRVFEIRDRVVHPTPGGALRDDAQPMPVEQLRQRFAALAERAR